MFFAGLGFRVRVLSSKCFLPVWGLGLLVQGRLGVEGLGFRLLEGFEFRAFEV